MSSAGRSAVVRTLLPSLLLPILLGLTLVAVLVPAQPATAVPGLGAGGPLPLAFEPNQGQADPAVRFVARGRGYGLFLTPSETVLVLAPGDRRGVLARRPGPTVAEPPEPAVVRMRLVGSDTDARVSGVAPLPGRSHYFVGDAARWQRDVPTFARVHYADVYPGIGLVFYGNERELEYDFVVAPGADPGLVELAFDGAEGLRLDASGDLVITTGGSEVRLRRPVVYQDTEAGRQLIDGGYRLDGGRVRFQLAAWDTSRPLVIDPVLGYSTFLGGSSNDQGFGIAVDGSGNAYVTGSTISTDFPLSSSPAQPTRSGDFDVFVTKIDPTGTTVVYSTYLGGSGAEAGNAIAVDGNGSVYVTGSTLSNNFPVVGPFQATTRGASEAFVTKLDPTGSSLVYSTYLGSSADDFAFGIALDDAGNAYVTGSTASSGFPNNNAITCAGTKRTGSDAFVAKVNANGASLGYCRFIGGAGEESGAGIAADGDGNVWFVGSTTSSDLPVQSAFQPTRGGGTDGFVGRLDRVGVLVSLTYLGGSLDDEALAVAVDGAGNAYVTGSTSSINFPTVSPVQPSPGGNQDAFVAKVNAAGTALLVSTYLGGSGDDVGNGIAVHPGDSSIYVVGATGSLDFPLLSPIQDRLNGGLDAFATKLNSAGTGLVYSTYLGGTGDDAAQAVAVDGDGVAFLTGSTASATFPTVAPIQSAAGLTDAFVTQIADGGIIQFTGLSYQVNENGGTVTIGVQRTGDVSGGASVEFVTTDGTATAGADYVSTSGILTFAPGQIVATFPVTILDDAIGDGDETVTLTLRNPGGGAVLGGRRVATLTIADDEPAINFSAATYQAAENKGPATITVTRSGPGAGAVTVQFATSDGTATAGSDYTAVTRTLTFAAGVRTATVTVPILNDTFAEGTETVNLTLSNVSGGTPPAALGVRSTATLNITDDDVAGTVQFSAATYTVSEKAGFATITVTRSGGTAAGVTVNYTTSDGTASAGADYTLTTGTLTFGAGVTSQTFRVPILDDALAEGAETVNLTLSHPGGGATLGGVNAAVLTITDDEPTVFFSTDAYTVKEGTATATITVRRSGTVTAPATVDYTTADGTARAGVDYRATAGTLSFGAGIATKTFTVPILNDTSAAGARTVLLALSNATGAATIAPPSNAVLTITEDDAAGIIQFSADVFSAAENSGSAVITVSRSGGTAGGATISYATSDGTATAQDYTFVSGVLTFGAGETIKTFTIPLIDDALAEGVETVNLTLSGAGGGATLGTRATAVLRIIDDELGLAFSNPIFTVAEGGGSATITVELTGVNTVPVTVNYATSNGTATAGLDYTATAGTLVFPPGGSPTIVRTRTFTVPIIQDTLAEGTESLTLTLSNPTPTGVAQLVPGRSVAVLNITDDDQAGIIGFDMPTFTVSESAGTATIRVKRTQGTASGVTIDYATSDGTATAGLDYTATAGRLTFGAGETIKTFTVPILDDTLGEGPETVTLTLSNPGGGGTLAAPATAVLTIVDDEPHVMLSASSYSVSESAGSLTVTVLRGGVDTGTLTVDYATADQVPLGPGKAVGGVDYTPVHNTLTFAPGVRTRTFTVPILNDSTPEPDETFDVILSNPTISSGTVALVAPVRAQVTITDNDQGGTIQFSAPTYSVNENGGDAVVTVVRSGGQAGGVSVLFETGEAFPPAPGSVTQTATPNADYTPAAAGTRVTFGSGETQKTVRIPILTDALAEGVETINIRISDPKPTGVPGAPILGAQATATVMIIDEQQTVQFAKDTFTVAEGSAAASVTVERTGPPRRLRVDYATADLAGCTAASGCYTPASGTLTFEPTLTSQSFSVRLGDPPTITPDRSFRVTLSNLRDDSGAGATGLGPRSTASVTIKENDRGGTFTVTGTTVNEHDGTATVTVSRAGGSGGPVTVDFVAAECGIVAPPCDFAARQAAGPGLPQHFVPDSRTLTFQAGEVSQAVRITIVDNSIAEGIRNFAVSIRNPQPSVMQDGQPIGPIIGSGDALVTIIEDELYFVTLSAENYTAPEATQQILIPVVRSGSPSTLAAPLSVDVLAIVGGDNPAVVSLDYTGGLGSFAGSRNGYAPAPGFLAAPSPGSCPSGPIVARQTLTFAANQTTVNFPVPYLDDTVVDGPKTIIVCLNDTLPRNSVGGPGMAFPASGTLTIADDDVGGSIEFAADVYSVAENVAGGTAIITLTRTGTSSLASAVTVVAETGDRFAATVPPQTAVAGSDYTSTGATVTFAAGQASQSFTVPISNPGGSPNGVKTVNLQLSTPDASPGGGAMPSVGTRSKAVLRIVDATQTVAFTLPNYDVSEGAAMATLSIERTGDVSSALSVTVSTADGAGPAPAALAGVDYQATVTTVTFGPQQSMATVNVPIINNNMVAPDKTFRVSLSGAGVDPAGRVDATVTIKDDDAAGVIAFGAPTFTVQENGGEAEITIVRSGGTAGCPLPLNPTPPTCPDATLVTFSTADGTATAGATPGTGDYDAKTQVVEFGAGEQTKTVKVTINPDAVVEGTETVSLQLSNPLPTGAGVAGRGPTLGAATATLQILETEFRIGATAYTVSEGTGRATITVVRTGDLGSTSLLSFVTADQTVATAVAGTDYTASSGTLTFGPGESLQTFDILLTDESLAESDESFDVVFSVPGGGNATIARDSCDSATPATGTVATCTVVVTILDNESGGVLNFSEPVYEVTEPTGGSTTATITVRRIVGGAGNVTVVWDVLDGSAVAGTHFVRPAAVGARTLTFGPGETTQTFTVTVLPDTTVGVQTATLVLRSATGGATVAIPGTATLRITDRDNSVGFDAPAFTVAENAGTASVTVRRTGTVGTVTVDYVTTPGTATAPGDYTAITGTLTFPAGTALRTIAVPIVNDAVLESTESFSVTLSNLAVAPGAAGVQFAPDSCANPGATTTCSAPVTILDDDQGGVIQFASPTYSVSEGAGTATIALARTGGLAGGVTVSIATTPASSPDFSLSSGTVTFAPGQSTANATLTINNNSVAEADRTVTLTISNVQPAGLGNSPLLGVLTSATLTILDDEPRVTFASPIFSVAEGAGVATITLQRSGNPGTSFTIDYATSDGTATAPADYTASSGTVTFPAGALTASFTVPIVNDNIVDGPESLTLTLSNPVGAGIDRSNCAIALPAAPALATTCTATLQIIDDDQPGTIAFNASTYTVSEPAGGAPAATLVVTITRTGGNAGGISVNYAAVDGTAVNGTDFVLAPGSVTFGVNETAKTFTVSIPDHPGSQGNRTFRLVLSNPTAPAAFGTPSQATVTIVDDDQTVKFSALGYSVLENQGPASIVVERLGTAAGTVTVHFSTSNGSATAPTHYTAVNRTLTFGPNIRTQTVPIPIVNNGLVDSNRRFTVTLDTLTSTSGTIALARATCATATPVTDPVTSCSVPVDIVDDDQGGIIQFSSSVFTVTEGTPNATITLVRTGGVGGPVTVDFTTADGLGTASAGADYTPVSRTVTFGTGVTMQSVLVPIINDTLAEGVKSVVLELSNPTGGASVTGPRRTASLNISSNDTAGSIQFSQPVYTVAEDVPGGVAQIILSRTGGAASGVTVRLSTADGPGAGGAQAGTDYTAVSSVITFAANQTTQTATVPILNGTGAEGVKPVLLALSSPGGGGVLGPRSTAVLNIMDDEATVGFSVADLAVTEGTTATLTVMRTGPLTGTVTVAYATADDTAVSTGPLPDYRAVSGVLTFGPNVKTRTVTIPTITDVRDEGPSKAFNVTLSAPAGAALGRQSTARVTIAENDVAGTFRFRSAAYQVAETAGFRFVQVERVGGAAGPVMVDFTTVDGTARAGIDYTTTSGTITMGPTQFLVNLVVPVLNNRREDGARSFSLRLSAPAGGTGGASIGSPSTTVVTITDDDEGGQLQFGTGVYMVNECAALPCEAVLTVARTGGVASGVSVDFATADGTATALNDYTAMTGTLNFAAGVIAQTIRIPLQIEPGAQATKTFSVLLSNPRGGATLGPRSAAEVQVRDTH